jgi:hypothetical protein
MMPIADSVREHLQPLLGLRLSASYRAADMRVFHFGTLRQVGTGAVGEFALHVQCPWRIQARDRIVTGHHDLFEPAEVTEHFDWESWDWDGNETLQDKLISEFLAEIAPTVQGVVTDACGGAILDLSGEYALVLFPAGTKSEDWRLFRPGRQGHFVVSGGREEPGEQRPATGSAYGGSA